MHFMSCLVCLLDVDIHRINQDSWKEKCFPAAKLHTELNSKISEQ